VKKKEGLELPEKPLDKILAHLDTKTIVLIVAVLGGGGGNAYQALKPEAPSIPLDQYTSVVTVLTQEKAAAVTERDAAVAAKNDCQKTLLKRRGNRPAGK
jgi:hypothetical protein